MANPRQVMGRAKVAIGGSIVPTAGDVKLDPGGTSREEVSGDYEVGAFRAQSKGSTLEVPVMGYGSVDAIGLGEIEDQTVMVAFDNGRTYTVPHAWAEGPPQLDTSTGKYTLTLHGQPAQEVA